MVLVTRRDASQILADSRGVLKPRNFSKELKGLSKKKITVFKKQHIFLFRLFSRWNYMGRAEPVSLWMLYGEGPTPTLFRAASDRFFTVHQLSELTWQKISNFFFLPAWRALKRPCICRSIGVGTKDRGGVSREEGAELFLSVTASC